MGENAEPAKPDSGHEGSGHARSAEPGTAQPHQPQSERPSWASKPPERVSRSAQGPGKEGDAVGESHFGINSEGKFHYLPHRLAQRLNVPGDVQIVDPRFARYYQSYFLQAGLAVVAMLLVLLFVDSLSDAALAAGLGSSLVILFVHPSSAAAKPRSVIGGHGLALVMGLVGSGALFNGPVGAFLHSFPILFDLMLATGVGLLILGMAITNTEHPPAAGTVLGVAMQPWDPVRVGIIIIAVILLALLKWLLNARLRDLI